jgi:hypothetical protein
MAKNNKLKHLADMTNELRQRMQKEGRAALAESFSEFFSNHPEAKAIVWTQCTPYFNDGDTCYFSVHDFELKVDPAKMAEDVRKVLGFKDDEDEDDEEEDYDEGCAATTLNYLRRTKDNRESSWNPCLRAGVALRPLTTEEQALVKDFNELDKACHEIEEVLEIVLGDHVRVTATRKGFDVAEFDHD